MSAGAAVASNINFSLFFTSASSVSSFFFVSVSSVYVTINLIFYST